MYQARQCVVSKYRNKELFCYFEGQASLACDLYNAALFRIRQIFTGWDKLSLTSNEAEVFLEVAHLEHLYPSVHVKRVISYSHLEKLMRATENPDFFAGLPMQTAQHVVRRACEDFKDWLKALKSYKKDPSKFLGKPRMPHYKNPGGFATYSFTNQDAVLYPADNGYELKLPLTKERLSVGRLSPDARLKECKVKPYYGRFLVCLTFEAEDIVKDSDLPNMAAIDLGTHNIAAIVCTDGSSRLYKGDAILARNQLFAKIRAKAVADITHGHKNYAPQSRRLDNLSFGRNNFNRDQCHKISKDIIRYCLSHGAGTLVLGVNKHQKQGISLGRNNDQLIYGVPLYMLRQMIAYKAAIAGIDVVIQEESYTSKADFTANDYIPTYGVDDADASFSGRRTKRGLYRCHNGRIINADLNGAANILRKAFPEAFDNISGYGFLSDPEVSGFHELNPKCIPAERIAAA